MADEQVTQPVVTQGNETAARTETGEIKDQQTSQTVTTPETKPAETKTEPSTETKAETKTEPGKVPDKYEFKAPEGFELDAKAIADAEPIFKELGLSQEAASKLVDFYAKHSADALAEATKSYETTRVTWRDEIVKNPALGDGKEGLRPEVSANISKAMDALGDAKAVAAFKEALDLTGAGDNPAVVAAMNTFGKLLSEGTAVKAGGPAAVKAPGSAPTSAAKAMFPNLKSAMDQ